MKVHQTPQELLFDTKLCGSLSFSSIKKQDAVTSSLDLGAGDWLHGFPATSHKLA